MTTCAVIVVASVIGEVVVVVVADVLTVADVVLE